MSQDYMPPPDRSRSNTGLVVAIVAALLLVPLVCCGLGLGSWVYTRVEVQQQMNQADFQRQRANEAERRAIEEAAEQTTPLGENSDPDATQPPGPAATP
jgi:hypothetical protein